ncbi:MAG: hypothetical protein J6C53_03165, partial [Clostridia bacterium]|nr:hypothetical protein [Clostridia bacterium]
NISTLTNATKTLTFDNGSADGEQTIPAKTSKVYTMEIKVTDTNASASVEYDFNFDLKDASVSQNQGGESSSSSVDLKWDSTNNYWYVTMGSTDTLNEIKWRLVGVEGERYTSTTKPTSGTGTFILETLIDSNALNKTFDSSDNDYATSDIRAYLNGDYKTFLSLTDDATYNAIAERSVADMYTDIGWNVDQENSSYAENAVYSISTTNSESDKLWLMSVAEVYTLLGGGTITDGTISYTWSTDVKNGCNWDADSYDDLYWLRSPYPDDSSVAFFVEDDGYWNLPPDPLTPAIRPAFNLEF